VALPHVTPSTYISFAYKIFEGFGMTPVGVFIRTVNESISVIVNSTRFYSG
jgi:hypothetical protein